MNVFLNCFECQETQGIPNVSVAEYNDSGVFDHTCSKGHRSVTIIQQNRAELLFDIACNAINDGYYREAVSSFAASLERFYEHAIRVMLRHSKAAPDIFTPCWNEVSNQSERQLGAFIFLWAASFGEKPCTLETGEEGVKFRNKVVHKGYIPNRDEAIAFGEKVYSVMAPLRARLSKEMEEACREVVFDVLHSLRPKGYTGRIATAFNNHLLNSYKNDVSIDLRSQLASVKQNSEMMKMFGDLLSKGSLIAPQDTPR